MMGAQNSLPSEKSEPKKEEAPTKKGEAPPTSSTTSSSSTAAPSPMMIESVSKDIKLWCSAANVEPSSLTKEIIREKAASRYSNVPDGVLVAAVEKIKKGE